MKPRAAVVLTSTEVILTTPYVDGFVDALKDYIPYNRRWDTEMRSWRISRKLEKLVLDVLSDYYDPIIFAERDAGYYQDDGRILWPKPPPPPPPHQPYVPQWSRTLHVSPDAPEEVIRAAYRALAHLNHPDKGGSAEKMAALNVAFEQAVRDTAKVT